MTPRRLVLAALYIVTAALLAGAMSGQLRAQSSSPETDGLMGAPVFASDGVEVGEVADFSTNGRGAVTAIKFKTGRNLGFGERIVVMREGMFMLLQGAVVLDFPAEALEALPNKGGGPSSQDDDNSEAVQ